jgi:nitroreductase
MRRINRRKFLIRLGEAVPFAALGLFLLSDKSNLTRDDLSSSEGGESVLRPDEKEILILASLAPSGHNTQPWLVEYIEPGHWFIDSEKSRWLPAVDPKQRETVLSVGAFAENLEYAASHFGYRCDWTPAGANNQSERLLEVHLTRAAPAIGFDVEKLRNRRTLRGAFAPEPLSREDLDLLIGDEAEHFTHLPAGSPEAARVGELTIEANRDQTYRDDAQHELSEWVRFTNREARRFRDGLTTASMEIDGVPGWFVRNLYIRDNVMSSGFREKGLARVAEQVAGCGGWILMTSPDDTTASLIDAGRRFERLFVKVRERGIAIHPMTQILEEEQTRAAFASEIEFGRPVQFILRTGYVGNYPAPVSLRRPPDWFVRG